MAKTPCDVVMTSLHHDDGIEILATSTTMTSEVCATSRMIDIGLTLVSATTLTLTLTLPTTTLTTVRAASYRLSP